MISRILAYYEALKMIKHKTLRRFAVLSGARRVGKTTIMYQMMDHLIDEIQYTDNWELWMKVIYDSRKAKDNQKEVDVVVELPREIILCEVKYRNNSHISAADAIV